MWTSSIERRISADTLDNNFTPLCFCNLQLIENNLAAHQSARRFIFTIAPKKSNQQQNESLSQFFSVSQCDPFVVKKGTCVVCSNSMLTMTTRRRALFFVCEPRSISYLIGRQTGIYYRLLISLYVIVHLLFVTLVWSRTPKQAQAARRTPRDPPQPRWNCRPKFLGQDKGVLWRLFLVYSSPGC